MILYIDTLKCPFIFPPKALFFINKTRSILAMGIEEKIVLYCSRTLMPLQY